MTTREYFTAVLNAHLSDEMDAASKTLLQKLDEKNAKRASADSKEKKEAAARRNAVLEFLQAHKGEVFTRDAIAEATGVSPAAVSSAVKALGEQVSKTEIKVDKAKRVAYTIPADNDEDEEGE